MASKDSSTRSPLPSRDFLLECFDYDPDTGVLRWKARPLEHFSDCRSWKIWNTRYSSSQVKYLDSNGYVRVRLGGKLLSVHRVAWVIFHGSWPTREIDHINGNRSDNRLTNLRIATHEENLRNRSAIRTNTSGIKGVSFHKVAKKFRARIVVDGSEKHLGLFQTQEEARAAYCAAADKYHCAFANYGTKS